METSAQAGRTEPAVLIGTSGWHYGHWRGVFYPSDLAPADYLAFYSREFSTVEINNTFYHLPRIQTAKNWRTGSPDGFCFAVKASQYITHRKRLKEPQTTLTRFFDVALELGEKLGPILFQLPPRFRVNLPRLEEFLQALPQGPRYAFEFRDHSWFIPEVAQALSAASAAFCLFDQSGPVTPFWTTAPFVYVRLHGAAAEYQGSYTDAMLRAYADRIDGWAAEGRSVFCYFNNDPLGNAICNARTLKGMVPGAR